jgi:hypothetical protein
LEVEALKLYSAIVIDFSIKFLGSEDLATLSHYISRMHIFSLGNQILQGVQVQRWDSEK